MSNRPSNEQPSSRRFALFAAGLFAFSFLLRLIGIGWGLADDQHNQSFHPDEYFIWSRSQLVKPAQGQFLPGFYNYGTLYLTTLRVASDITAAYTGGPKEGDPASFWAYVARCNLAGRLISAAAGAGTVAVVFFLILKFSNLWAAIFGALVPAVAPGFVVHSRFQTVDVLATFFLALSSLYAIKILYERLPEGKILRWAVLCGVFVGCSAGTKYTGGLGILSLYAALALARPPKALLAAGAGTAAAIFIFFLTTPGAIFDQAQFMRDFGYEMAHTSSGHGLLFEGVASGFLYHLANLQAGLGVILFFTSFGGLIWAVCFALKERAALMATTGTGSREAEGENAEETSIPIVTESSRIDPPSSAAWVWVLLAFALPYYILIGRAEVAFLRYTFPLYIILAAGLGFAVAQGRRSGGWGHGVVALALLGIGGFDYGGLRKSVVLSVKMASPDARESAVTALRDQAKQKPDLTVGFANDPWYYSPPTFPDTGLFRAPPFLQKMYQEMLEVSNPKSLWFLPPDVLVDPVWDASKLETRPRWDIRLLTLLKPDYIPLSNFEVFDINRLSGRTDISASAKSEVAQAEAFKAKLIELYTPFKEFGEADGDTVNDMMYVQPYIVLWKRKDLH